MTPEEKTEPVFIVGMPRTGSKIYKNIINFNSGINISPEIFFLTPKWIRDDFIETVKKRIGEIKSEQDLLMMVDLMFQNQFFGTYWRDIIGDKEQMVILLKQTDLSFKQIFLTLLKYEAEVNGKNQVGAKFPVHITKASELQKWFPTAKFVHINRHPLAIYNSQKRKHLKNTNGLFGQLKTITKVFFVTIFTYRSSCKFHKLNSNNTNYCFFEYEKLILNPEEQVKKLCSFLNIDYKEEMLKPPAKDSSYKSVGVASGIHKDSAAKWKKEVNFFERLIFTLFTKTSFSK